MQPDDRAPAPQPFRDFTLADWLVEPRLNRISREGTEVRLRPQLMDLLVFLAAQQGDVVSKDEILDAVWPRQSIAESGLARCIAEIRVVLGDDARDPRCIQTIHKRGYRLIAPVTYLPGEAPGTPGNGGHEAPRLDGAERAETASGVAMPADGAIPAATALVNGAGGAPSADLAGSATAPAIRRLARMLGRPWAAIGAIPIVGLLAFFLWLWSSDTAPALAERDTVLLADLVNRTGDSVFDGTLKLALAVQLEQSQFLKLVADEQVLATLRLMERAPDTPMVGPVAREICERCGAKALITGSVVRLEDHYAVGLEAVACRNGDVLARELAEADGKNRVLEALGLAASRLRVKLGETLPSVSKADVPIAQATTASLDALKAFSRGEAARETAVTHDDVRQVVAWYDEAIRSDPEFALAYARLGTVLRTTGEHDRARQVYQRAYDLRARVTDPERFYVESHYHFAITGEVDQGLQVLERWKRTYPSAYVPRYNLAIERFATGDLARATAEARAAFEIAPRSATAAYVLARGLSATGDLDEALRTINDARAHGARGPSLPLQLLTLYLARQDQAGIDRVRQEIEQTPGGRVAAGVRIASAAMGLGHRQRGVAAYRALREAVQADTAETPAIADIDLWEAFDEALLGNVARAREIVSAVPVEKLPRGVQAIFAHLLVRAGATDQASRLVEKIASAPRAFKWPHSMADDVVVPMTRALVMLSTGRALEAQRLIHEVSRYELWPEAELEPLLARAEIHLRSGQYLLAEEAYRKLLAHTGAAPNSLVVPVARLGLARTLAGAGRVDEARQAYDDFIAAWPGADADIPILIDAQRERAAIPVSR